MDSPNLPQKIAELEQAQNSYNQRINTVETSIAKITDSIDLLQSSQQQMLMDTKLASKDMDYYAKQLDGVVKTLSLIDAKIDVMREDRVNDHYVEPLAGVNKAKWLLMGLIIAFVFNAVIQLLQTGA